MTRVKVLRIAAVVVAGLGLATSAKAADLSFDPFEQGRGDTVVEFVAGGCGPGFHPNPWGRCRPNDRGYGYGGPRRFYEGRPYGYGDSYGRRGSYEYDRPRRFYDGY
ncbi:MULTISPECIES: hypothetical protein [unclassified Methylobacterium]|uniref:GCG_CRPN prefix-to-repeats domain-containing protein n=1 Tax=unclassified Methylobacterium TaxID=2615210 RepID=UPI0009EBC77C|nr:MULTISPECIES: hypothetical protein [unclassified Methylobacterium]MCK2057153.1 hypothetical protein [Methylobacterium sp. 37f]